MKKKLLSILAALIICLSPVLFLAGCTPQEQNVTMDGKTGWTVAKDGSFASMSVPQDFKITYYKNQYNKKTEKYEDVKAEITTLADAIANGLKVISGFDSSTEGDKKMTVVFGGKYFEITYTVGNPVGDGGTDGDSGNSGTGGGGSGADQDLMQ